MSNKFKTEKITEYVEKYVKEYFGDIPVYSNEDVLKIYEEYKKTHDPKIKDKLVEANIRRVVRCAYNVHNKYKENDIGELVSIGLEQLLHVIEEYNDHVSTPFYSYVNSYITTYIERSPKVAGNGFDFNSNETMEMNTIKRFIKEYKKKHGYEPDPEYISQKTGIKAYRVKYLLSMMDEPKSMVNYNKLVTDDNKRIDNGTLFDEFFKMVDSLLDEREKNIIRLRFGLDGGKALDLESIAKELNISRERVRQILDKTLRKIRTRLSNIHNQELKNELLELLYGDGNLPFEGNLDTEDYTPYQTDYEGWSEEEFKENNFGLK